MADHNNLYQLEPHSQLFTVRIWHNTGQTSEHVPYIQVKHVLSGETRYFSAWSPLIEYLLSKLNSLDRPQGHT